MFVFASWGVGVLVVDVVDLFVGFCGLRGIGLIVGLDW